MNRRKFCKIASLTILSSMVPEALKAAAGVTADNGVRLPRCRIDVLRRECFVDIQSRYLDDPETGPCPLFSTGQSFTVENANSCPTGFCPKAWKSIREHVEAVMSSGKDTACGNSTTDRAIIACCSDGSRPVIFKITPV